jgi:hypothetical protein
VKPAAIVKALGFVCVPYTLFWLFQFDIHSLYPVIFVEDNPNPRIPIYSAFGVGDGIV